MTHLRQACIAFALISAFATAAHADTKAREGNIGGTAYKVTPRVGGYVATAIRKDGTRIKREVGRGINKYLDADLGIVVSKRQDTTDPKSGSSVHEEWTNLNWGAGRNRNPAKARRDANLRERALQRAIAEEAALWPKAP